MHASDGSLDQAEGLRRVVRPEPVKVIAIASGKGGVGKTNVSTNLALALIKDGKDVMLMDADLGLGNIDVLLGLYPVNNLGHVIRGECTLEEAIVTGPSGLRIIPASSGIEDMASLSAEQHAGLVSAFSELHHSLDVLLIDTAAGITDSVLTFSQASQEVIVVVCDEPASITDAYALIKVLSRERGLTRFHVLVNMASSAQQAQELFGKLFRVTDRFLEVALDYMGMVPEDDSLRKAVRRQRAVVDAYPRSRSALAFKKLARCADNWPVVKGPGGHVEFFVERLIKNDAKQWVAEQAS